MMFIVRLLQWIFKQLVDAIDALLGLFIDDDYGSGKSSAPSHFKQHHSGSNLSALEALPPHYHQRQQQVLHHHNTHYHHHNASTANVHGASSTMPLQSTVPHPHHLPPYPVHHHGGTYHHQQRPVLLHHRKKSDDYDTHHNVMHTTNAAVAGGVGVGGGNGMPTMTHDQSVFFSVDDQQYQVWKQLNQHQHDASPIQPTQPLPPPQGMTARSTPTLLGGAGGSMSNEYDSSSSSYTSQNGGHNNNGSIHIDMDRLASQSQSQIVIATATNLQQNATNVHRRGSKSLYNNNNVGFASPVGASSSVSPAVTPSTPIINNRPPAASPDMTMRRKSIVNNNHTTPNNNYKPQNNHHQLVIDTVPSMLQKQTSDESNVVIHTNNNNNLNRRESTHKQPALSIIPPSMTDSNIATYNRGIRGSQPLVRLNRLTMLEAAKSSPESPSPPRKRSGSSSEDPSSRSPSVDIAKMSMLLPIIPHQELQGVDDKRNRIGGGAFGQVFRGFWKGTPVAIKFLSSIDNDHHDHNHEDEQMSSKVMSAFEEEVSILARLRHPNICLLLGICVERHHQAIVTELVSRGSLWDALRQKQHFQRQPYDPFFWPLSIIRKVLEGAGRGLAYLHNHTPPIIHRDLKSANILLDESFNVKICDFGLAKLRDLTTVMTANVGTVQWMAPEVLVGNAYDESVDIFSMALVCWEMLTGKCPYEGMKQVEVAIAVINHQYRPTLPSMCTPDQKNFLQKCWATQIQERPDAETFIRESNRIFV